MCPSVPKWAQVGPWAQVCPKVPTCSRIKGYARPVSVRVAVETCLYCFCMRGGRVFARRPKCAHVCPRVPKWAHGPTCAHVCTNEMAAVVNVTQLRPCHATNENACIHAWRVFIGGHTCGHMSIGHMPALSSCPSGGLCALFFKHRRVSWHDVHPGYVPGCSRGNIFLTWAQSGHSGPIGGMGTVAPMGTVGPMTHR